MRYFMGFNVRIFLMAKSIGLQAYQSNNTEAICRVIDGDIRCATRTFWLYHREAP